MDKELKAFYGTEKWSTSLKEKINRTYDKLSAEDTDRTEIIDSITLIDIFLIANVSNRVHEVWKDQSEQKMAQPYYRLLRATEVLGSLLADTEEEVDQYKAILRSSRGSKDAAMETVQRSCSLLLRMVNVGFETMTTVMGSGEMKIEEFLLHSLNTAHLKTFDLKKRPKPRKPKNDIEDKKD